jgi:uncharacterized MAPEG superfamily protein
MSTLLWTLIITAFLPYVWGITSGMQRARRPEGFDNRNPRGQAARLEGFGARAHAAQQNAWEALGVYTPCALVAHLTGADATAAGIAGTVFVAARLAHGVCYCMDLATLRSLTWFVGIGCCITLVVLSA